MTLFSGLAALAALAPAALAFTGVPVKAQPPPVQESNPAVSTHYIAWTQNSKAHPHSFNVFEQLLSSGVPTGTVRRVNSAGVQAQSGAIAGTRLAYAVSTGTTSDIRFSNLLLHNGSNPPVGVNTPAFEYSPELSFTWLMFGRQVHGTSRIVLFNLQTHSARRLFSIPRGSQATNFADPGQVNGNFATFYVCKGAAPACSVYLYTISTHTLTKISHPSNVLDRWPAVTATGTLWFNRLSSGSGPCSSSLVEKPLASPAVAVHAFTPGFVGANMQTYNDGTHDQLFYDRVSCIDDNSDIYRGQLP
ncbi:MAG: hypothetical protein ACTHNU_06500 [Gaiellales bacterium]